ncbi:TPA_asm: UL51.5 sORF 1 [Human alphaherpesvirus 1]|nr:TPA_asm: UL51.5 sORF 1 [Human alphaherpesvirus 1]
MGQGEVRLGRL